MADYTPLLWDPSLEVKRVFSSTDTLFLNTNGTNNVFDLQISSTSIFKLDDAGFLTVGSGSTTEGLSTAGDLLVSNQIEVADHGWVKDGLDVSESSITAAADVLGVTGTSGGISSATVQGVNITLSAHASDDTVNYYGVDLTFNSLDVPITKYGVNVDANWNRGIYTQSPVGYDIAGSTPFTYYDGSRASGTSGNINTDNADGEMIRIDVDDGAGGYNTRWVPAYSGTTMPGTTGNDLDEAYDAFGGAGTVEVDAGNLTWNVTSPYDFVIKDATGNNYIDVETNSGTLDLKTSLTNGHIGIAASGSAADVNISAAGATGGITLQSTSSTVGITSGAGTTIQAGGTSSWTVTSGNLNFSAGAGTMNLDPLILDVQVDRNADFIAGTSAGSYRFNLENQGASLSYVRTTGTGDLSIYADTGSTSADLTLASGGNTTLSCGLALDIHVDTAGDAYDLSLTVPDSTNQEITFNAHNSGDIAFNSAADVTPDTTAQSIIGAINEINTKVGAGTLDAAYNTDAGAATINVDAGNISWVNTGTYYSAFTKALTASPTGERRSLHATITSSADLGASDVLTAIRAEASGNGAGDAAGSEMTCFYAIGDSATSGKSYGLHADSNCEAGVYSESPLHVDANTSTSAPSASKGYLDVDVNADTLLSVLPAAIGVRSYVVPNASDTSGFRAFEAGMSGSSGGGTYTGFYVDAAYDTAFWAGSNVVTYGFRTSSLGEESVYVSNGTVHSNSNSSQYQSTTSAKSLVYAEVTSAGINGSTYANWYGIVSRYEHSTSDSNNPNWYGFTAEAVFTPAASGPMEAFGFYAKDNLDWGIESQAPRNKFERADDLSDTTDPLVQINQLDNDATGGTAAALLVKNAYNSTSSKVIEIDNAYDGSNTEDTRRAIVFTTAATNKRQIPVSTFLSHDSSTTTAHWQFQCTSTNQHWYCSTTSNLAMTIPLHVPHNAVIKSVDVQCDHGQTPTNNPVLTLYRHSSGASTSTSQGSQNGTLASGAQTITLSSLSVTVDNTQYDYYLHFINGRTASTSDNYLYSAHVTYEITDFAAGCGF